MFEYLSRERRKLGRPEDRRMKRIYDEIAVIEGGQQMAREKW
jgi:hypothetical protein